MSNGLFLAAMLAGTVSAPALGVAGLADIHQDDAGSIILAQGVGTPVGPDLRGPRDREPGGEGNGRPDTGNGNGDEGRGPADTVHPDFPRGRGDQGKGEGAHLEQPAIILAQSMDVPNGSGKAPLTRERNAAPAPATEAYARKQNEIAVSLTGLNPLQYLSHNAGVG
ncbi:hypothetical protein M728_000956 [Ensifer sp. WSM1721]